MLAQRIILVLALAGVVVLIVGTTFLSTEIVLLGALLMLAAAATIPSLGTEGPNRHQRGHFGRDLARFVAVIFLLVVVGPMLFFTFHFLAAGVSVRALEHELQRELSVGASAEQIEAWFGRKGLPYHFVERNRPIDSDREARYQTVTYHALATVEIKVYVDEQRRVQRLKVWALK